MPPKLTAVAPVKYVPVITTDIPVPVEVGVKLLMVGAPAVICDFGLFVANVVLYTWFPVVPLYSHTCTR